MDGLVMAGGRGTRLDFDGEKPLFEVGEVPMIDRVLAPLEESAVENIAVAVSPQTPETEAHVDVETIETPGEGYVEDLQYVLERLETPLLTVVADLPLIDGEAIDWVLSGYAGGSESVCVPVARKCELGVSVDTEMSHEGRQVTASGVNIFGGSEADRIRMTKDIRFAVNVNRLEDAAVAEAHL
jgi:adenosylcobinamide-phosphate guanylyltransferase